MTGQRGPAADLAEMLDALGNDRRVMGEVIELFLESAPSLLVELRAAVIAGDARRTRRIAHRLRGSASQFSNGEVKETLTRLEYMALTGAFTEAATELRRMERALSALMVAMGSYRLPNRRKGRG